MNLADAIRQAALRQAEEQGHKEPEMANNNPFNASDAQANTPEPAQPAAQEWTSGGSEEWKNDEPNAPQIHPVFQTAQETVPFDHADLTEHTDLTEPTDLTDPADFEPPVAQPAPQFSIETTDEEPPTWGNDTGKLTIATDPEHARELFASDSATGEPIEIPQAPNAMPGGNVVRFEIFLSPEQLSCLFRALVATQHSMMTLREAASYLRIPAATLEQLAAESKIPALQLEGRWRFPKSGIDEWVMLQSFRDGEVNDAA